MQVYLDYKTRDAVGYNALWSHGEQFRGPYPQDPRTFIMASEKSTPELPVLDKKSDDEITSEVSKITSSSHGERVVTRKELWSYYCKSRTYLPVLPAVSPTIHPQRTITVVLCVPSNFFLNQ